MVAGVHVVISCDVDPDRERFLDGVPPAAAGKLTWRGVDEGIPALKESLRGLTDHEGREPVFTWFLRVDDQVRQVEGSYAWFAGSRARLLEALTATGDELGWHPHFWRQEAPGGQWFQEIEDQPWQLDMLRGAHADYVKALGFAPRSVRMGWSYHTNETIAQLDALGIAVDLSGLPGYRTFDPKKTRSENLFDWYTTPQAPYRPSRTTGGRRGTASRRWGCSRCRASWRRRGCGRSSAASRWPARPATWPASPTPSRGPATAST